VVRAAVQLPSQQRCPALPHIPQAPLTHTELFGQSVPSATHVPTSVGLVRVQQPFVHRLSGQQACPGPPHARHIEGGVGMT
jgi:hypothetical protein